MSEDALQHQINELNDKVEGLLAVAENHQKMIEFLTKAIEHHNESLRATNESVRLLNIGVDALMARVAE